MPQEVPPKWAPNPYAIAQLLAGESEQLFTANGRSADLFLKEALLQGTDGETVSRVFMQFQALAIQLDKPEPLSEKLKQPAVEKLIQRYGEERVQRMLHFLLPVTDAVFDVAASNNGLAGANAMMSVRAWYADADQLLLNDASYLDPIQGYIADCYLIATIIALAWIKSELLFAGLRGAGFNPPVRSFAWRFHGDAGADLGISTVTGKIPVSGARPRYARSATIGEYWPSLLEKVFVRQMRPALGNSEPTPADYQSIDRGLTPQRACQMLVGGQVKGSMLEMQSIEEIFFAPGGELATRDGGVTHPVVAWTRPSNDPRFWDKTGLWQDHAYAVLGFLPNGDVVLRNPYGVSTVARPGWSEDEKWTPEGRDEVKLNKHGVFGLSQDLFREHFNNIGWVNLPGSA